MHTTNSHASRFSFFLILSLVLTGSPSARAVVPASPSCGADNFDLGLLGATLDVTLSLLESVLNLLGLLSQTPPQPCPPTGVPATTTSNEFKGRNFLVQGIIKRLIDDISLSGLFIASETAASKFNISSQTDLVGCAQCSLIWGTLSELNIDTSKSLFSHLGFNVTSNATLRLTGSSLHGKSTRADPAYTSQDGPIFIDQNARLVISAPGTGNAPSAIAWNARVQFLNGAKLLVEKSSVLQVNSSVLDFDATSSVQIDSGARVSLAQAVLKLASNAINLGSNSLFSIEASSTLTSSGAGSTFNLAPLAQFAIQAGAHLNASAASLSFSGDSTSIFNVIGNLTSGTLAIAGGSSQVRGKIAVSSLTMSGSTNLDIFSNGEIASTSVNLDIAGLLRVQGSLSGTTLSQINGNIDIDTTGSAKFNSLTMQSGVLRVRGALDASTLSQSNANITIENGGQMSLGSLTFQLGQLGGSSITLSTDSILDITGGSLSAIAGIEISASANSSIAIAGQMSLGAESRVLLDGGSNLALSTGALSALAKLELSALNNSTLTIDGQLSLAAESRLKFDSGSKFSLSSLLSLPTLSVLSADVDSEIAILGGLSLDANAAISLSNGVKLSAQGDATASNGAMIALQTAASADLASSLSLDAGASVLLAELTQLNIVNSLLLSNSSLVAGLESSLSVGEIINLSGSAALELSGSLSVPWFLIQDFSSAVLNNQAIVSVSELLVSGSTLQIAGETTASAKVSVLNGASLTVLGSLISSNASSILQVDGSVLTLLTQEAQVSMGVLVATANSKLNVAGSLQLAGDITIRDSLLDLSTSGHIQAAQVLVSGQAIIIAGTIDASGLVSISGDKTQITGTINAAGLVTISGSVQFGKPSSSSGSASAPIAPAPTAAPAAAPVSSGEPAQINGNMKVPPSSSASGPVHVNGTYTNEGNLTDSSSNTVVYADNFESKNGSTIQTTFTNSNESRTVVYSQNTTVEPGTHLEVTAEAQPEPGQRITVVSCSDTCQGAFSSYTISSAADGSDQTCQWQQQADSKQLSMLFVGPSNCNDPNKSQESANEQRLQLIITIVIPVIIVALAVLTLVIVFAVPRLRMRVMPFLERRMTVQTWASEDESYDETSPVQPDNNNI